MFGPIMVTWFLVVAVLGTIHIADDPGVFRALNPWYAIRFFPDAGFHGFLALGSVFLVVTGGEALYADMGHFGRRPIQLGWFALVLPALLLNYFGQGAMLLAEPGNIDNPFYRLAPDWGVVPLVVLATAATVIASQALISGVYSLTMQAVQLSYSPRVQITHTSATEVGQIYIPALNWGLMLACIGLVLGFRSSTALAAAYGVAVTTTMVITTLLLYVVLRERFGWRRGTALVLCAAFLVMDLGFFVANLFKIPDGGWFPLVVGAAIFTLMTTWRTGRRLVGERLRGRRLKLETYLEGLMRDDPPTRVPGTAVYLFSMPGLTPPALLANVRHNKVLHEQVVVVGVVTDESPRVLPARRTKVVDVGHGVRLVQLRYGFMEEPDVPSGLTEGVANKLSIDPRRTTYVLGSESLVVTDRPGMMKWREHLFALMSRNATSAANYFCLPPEQIMTVGVLVEL
jgi:KUP system potassium uptake protein